MWHYYGLGRRRQTTWHQCVASDTLLPCLTTEANVTHSHDSEGSTVAVFGCGCVGLSCINAATLAGASRVIAIDVNRKKEAWARKFGATDFVDPRGLPDGKRIQDHLVELTDGGLDFTFDATGNVSSRREPLKRPEAFHFVDRLRCTVVSCRSTSCAPR